VPTTPEGVIVHVRTLRRERSSWPAEPLDVLFLDSRVYAAASACSSGLRLRDLDLERGTVRFYEKGARTIVKPLPIEFEHLLRHAIDAGGIEATPDPYVMPMARRQSRGLT
jgi:hypothetical protein